MRPNRRRLDVDPIDAGDDLCDLGSREARVIERNDLVAKLGKKHWQKGPAARRACLASRLQGAPYPTNDI
ncbi:MAG: hypothetical protein F4Y02_15810 [Chloroflexi bacterium]|nr:hypothetical protein [Chloroflexota bacterium]